MIVNVELADSGVEKFNKWFKDVAGDRVRMEVIAQDVCEVMFNRISTGESLVYELGSQYTCTGRPEHLHLDRSDVEVTEDADE